jgi:PAS domain S-box-containing protein
MKKADGGIVGGGMMGEAVRQHDWSLTPLGPLSQWTPTLRSSLNLMLNSQFPMFFAWGDDLTFIYNDAYAPILVAKHPGALGRPFALIWADIWADLDPLVRRALQGEATYHENLPLMMLRRGFSEQTYFTFSYSPAFDDDGEIRGMFCACTETTALVREKAAKDVEQRRLREYFEQAPGFMALLSGPTHVFELTNAAYMRLVGDRDLIGKSVRDALPEVEGQGFFDLLDQVYATGEAYVGSRLLVHIRPDPTGSAERRWVDFVYQPIRDELGNLTGIFVEGTDVTEAYQFEQALLRSEQRLRLAQKAGRVGSFELKPAEGLVYISDQFCELWGLPAVEFLPIQQIMNIVVPEDRLRIDTGNASLPERALEYVEYRIRRPDNGEVRWIGRRGEVIRDNGEIYYGGVVYDVTDRKRIEEQLLAERERLQRLNRIGASIAAELDVGRLVRNVIDDGVELTRAAFGVFVYKQANGEGESQTHYAWSGLDVSSSPMMLDAHVFEAAFQSVEIVRSLDVATDPRIEKNAPGLALLAAHLPVRSYLAVPVISRSAEVLGGIFFGHSDPDVFDERSEGLMSGLAGQVATAIDNAHLFDDVQKSNAELEHRVRVRTQELSDAQEALRQAQKMEAIGQLTGGIAHDFNNMLAVISGSLELLMKRAGALDARARRYIETAAEGANRAAQLTQRLLSFARQQPLQPEPTQCNTLVRNMLDLLSRSLGPQIELCAKLDPDLWWVEVDLNQIENVLLNLAVNARDAMPKGGRVTVTTENVVIASGHPELPAGDYVIIRLADTGEGMPPDVARKAFDPFFTTKEVGKGTGLGLSQAYGFAKQSRGRIEIQSQPGQGTTVSIFMPRYTGQHPEKSAERPGQDEIVSSVRHLVLVVDDEASVRRFSSDALSEFGCKVIEAESASEALAILRDRDDVALLFSDIVMPGASGVELAHQARKLKPSLKVLLTTGYPRDALSSDLSVEEGWEILPKPFHLDELSAKIQSILDDGAGTK